MPPERDYQSLLESVADGANIDWAALDASAATSGDRARYRNLRLVARVAELHRTLVLDEEAASSPVLVEQPPTPDPTAWGHLRITARIASGSFGRIYRAHDSQLDRDVALKLLRGDVRQFRPVERLLTEARTLAQVRHPNVVTVHGADVRDGRAGLWMEFVEGRTLDDWLGVHGRLGASEATTIGIDLCRALASVHAAGLVHGDVKAQNVMREQDGRIVLMDFGAGRAQGGGIAGVAGTPMYLAPEVLAGEPPTTRSDLYSLGVLLFHLLTGAFPYSGADIDDLRDAHANGERKWLRDLRPDLPSEVVQTIERALDPDPARRFSSAGEMERALGGALRLAPTGRSESVSRRWLSIPAFALAAAVLLCVVVSLIVWSGRSANSAGVTGIRSIAVLPMTDLSAATAPSDIAEGLHDQLVTTLGQIESLRVVSRSSVLKFKDSNEAAGKIAKDLGVDVALESTVSTSDGSTGAPGRVRVNASLLLAGATTPLWTRTFVAPRGDLLRLEGEIAQNVASSVRASMTSDESARLRHVPQTNPAAEEAFFQGRMNLEGYGADAAHRALDAFERALTLDPHHAGAHAGAAFAYISLAAGYGAMTHQKARALALEHANQALALRDDLAEAHAAMADIAFLYDWNAKKAEEEYLKALDLNPSLTIARTQYAQLLAATKRFDSALTQATEAEALEPGGVPTLKALLLYYKRDYEAAEAAIASSLSQRPDLVGVHIVLGRIAEVRGRLPEALDETRRALELSRGNAVLLRAQIVRLEALNGHRQEAATTLRQLQQDAAEGRIQLTSRDQAYIWLAFGDKERALQAFARAIDERDPSLVWLGVDPRVDGLRQDSRFVGLLNQLGL